MKTLDYALTVAQDLVDGAVAAKDKGLAGRIYDAATIIAGEGVTPLGAGRYRVLSKSKPDVGYFTGRADCTCTAGRCRVRCSHQIAVELYERIHGVSAAPAVPTTRGAYEEDMSEDYVVSRKPSNYVPAPDGEHNAVCVDLVDLGMMENFEGKMQHKCRVVWEIDKTMEDGRRFTVGKTYTVSLHERANLYKDLVSWRGRDFTEEELAAFSMAKLLGAPCRLYIVHDERKGDVYANVANVTKAKEVKLKASGQYVRKKDRDDYKPPKNSPWNPKTKPQDNPSPAGPLDEDGAPAF